MTFSRIAFAVLVTGSIFWSPAHAIDGFAVEVGGGDGVAMGRVAAKWDWGKRLLQLGEWHIGGFWDASLGYWHKDDVRAGEHDNLFDLGFTPTFRLQPNGLAGPFVEAAIGFHLLSHSSIGGRNMSTAFQFGDHVGIGYRFGAKDHFEIAYRFQHLSNASIKRPNPGINFHQIRLQYNY